MRGTEHSMLEVLSLPEGWNGSVLGRVETAEHALAAVHDEVPHTGLLRDSLDEGAQGLITISLIHPCRQAGKIVRLGQHCTALHTLTRQSSKVQTVTATIHILDC